MILTTVLVASKMFNDTYYTNQYIAQVGGVTLKNINELERFFMHLIDWKVNITTEEFDLYEKGLSVYPIRETMSQQMSASASSQASPMPSPQQHPVASQTHESLQQQQQLQLQAL